jgi:hypothetical protein
MLGCTGSYGDQEAGTFSLAVQHRLSWEAKIANDEVCVNADPNTSTQDVYIHGYVSGRIFNSGKNADGPGLPVTIAATYIHPPFPFPSPVLAPPTQLVG